MSSHTSKISVRVPSSGRLLPLLLVLLTYHGSLLRRSPSPSTPHPRTTPSPSHAASSLHLISNDLAAGSWDVPSLPMLHEIEGESSWWRTLLRGILMTGQGGSNPGWAGTGVGAEPPPNPRPRPHSQKSSKSPSKGGKSRGADGRVVRFELVDRLGRRESAHRQGERAVRGRRVKRGSSSRYGLGLFDYNLPLSSRSVRPQTEGGEKGGEEFGGLEVDDTMFLLPPPSRRHALDHDNSNDFVGDRNSLEPSSSYKVDPSSLSSSNDDDVGDDVMLRLAAGDVSEFLEPPASFADGHRYEKEQGADELAPYFDQPALPKSGLRGDVITLQNLLMEMERDANRVPSFQFPPRPVRTSSRSSTEEDINNALASSSSSSTLIPARSTRSGTCRLTSHQRHLQETLNAMENLEEDYMARAAYYRDLYTRDNHNLTGICHSFPILTSRIDSGMNNLSLCPWRLERNYREDRFPRTLWFAQCICGHCSGGGDGGGGGGGGGSSSSTAGMYTCLPLYHRINVIHEACERGTIHFRWSHEDVPVGCFCARPSIRHV